MNEDLKKKLNNEIKNNDICLFMKGTPDVPQCGFSLYLMLGHGVHFPFFLLRLYKQVYVVQFYFFHKIFLIFKLLSSDFHPQQDQK
jgi:hypothetical protein